MPTVSPALGPVAVTGASGFIGSHVVLALARKGYAVRACITDPGNPLKTEHLLAMNEGHPGSVTLHQANLLEEGSYDAPFAGCCAVMHVGTAMGYGGANKPQQVYDAAVGGTQNVVRSLQKAGTVRRIVYTSSFSAISHPAPSGYMFTEDDWASDNRENDPSWSLENLDEKGEVGYAMGKVATERYLFDLAAEDGAFEAISICPLVVLGPLLGKAHDLVFSWQWFLGRMLRGKDCTRGWQHLWNIVDVRDVATACGLALSADISGAPVFIIAAADTVMPRDSASLMAEVYPGVALRGDLDGQQTLLSIDRARHELGYEPRFSWRDEVAPPLGA